MPQRLAAPAAAFYGYKPLLTEYRCDGNNPSEGRLPHIRVAGCAMGRSMILKPRGTPLLSSPRSRDGSSGLSLMKAAQAMHCGSRLAAKSRWLDRNGLLE